MGFLKKYSAKLFLKQWNIGLCNDDIAAVIRQKKTALSFKWVLLPGIEKSIADPFVFTEDGVIKVLYEDFTTDKLDGKIALMTVDSSLKKVSQKDIIVSEHHLSYPAIFHDNGDMYVIPENAFSKSVYCYKWDKAAQSVTDKREILSFELIDPTIIFYEKKYWLFGTKLDDQKGQDKNLHIFYSESLFGPYQPHGLNPVKSNLDGSRPAGNFIVVDNQLYRPAQNSANYYGESITINRIRHLSESLFEEEEYMRIYPDKSDRYSKGIHTLNVSGSTIIADGLRFYFQPVQQLKRWLKKR